MKESRALSTALSTYCSFGIAEAFFNKTNATMWVQHLQLWYHSLKHPQLWCHPSFSQALPSSHGLFLECIVYPPGLPAVKGHMLQTPGRSLWTGPLLPPACCHWEWWANICFHWHPSHLLRASPLIPLNRHEPSSGRVASSKYHTLKSDWTPRAASSTDRAKEGGSNNWASLLNTYLRGKPILGKDNLVGEE